MSGSRLPESISHEVESRIELKEQASRRALALGEKEFLVSIESRIALIKEIEQLRGSTIVCYLTSLRPNVMSVMSDDAVRIIFDHLLLLPSRPVEKLDIFLCSNGGAGTVPWRLVSLFREFAKTFNVLIPYRAYSAASLLALGADEIVMHPFGELGPIDPTVSNEFNPTDNMGRRLGINVEDVTAYVNFIKDTVGITHEDELVKVIQVLAEKVHPIALGNVERFLSQSRMIARKILRTHMKDTAEHEIEEIVENMASKLYFHGHPINRQEAKVDLGLKVENNLPPNLEAKMWELYKDYEQEFQNMDIFNPAGDLAAMAAGPPAAGQPAAAPHAGPPTPAPPPSVRYELLHAMVESGRLSSKFVTERRYELVQLPAMPMQPIGQPALREDVLFQGWRHSKVP